MRLHHLEVTAFGPFADQVSVDFDALSDAGLFLLTGATGAGKTSVLDAVCFALYGEVPGDRQTAKRLRSDQAAEGVRPSVSLEVTLSGRRFRIVRSPAWERPKKRGTGLDHRAGVGAALRATRRRLAPARQPARRDRPPDHPPGRHEPRPVLPGRDAAPGPVPGLPAGPLRGAAQAAPAAVPHHPLRGHRALAARPSPRAAPAVRRVTTRWWPTWSAGSARPPTRRSPTRGTPTTSPWPADAGEIDHWSALQRERAAAARRRDRRRRTPRVRRRVPGPGRPRPGPPAGRAPGERTPRRWPTRERLARPGPTQQSRRAAGSSAARRAAAVAAAPRARRRRAAGVRRRRCERQQPTAPPRRPSCSSVDAESLDARRDRRGRAARGRRRRPHPRPAAPRGRPRRAPAGGARPPTERVARARGRGGRRRRPGSATCPVELTAAHREPRGGRRTRRLALPGRAGPRRDAAPPAAGRPRWSSS